MSEEELNQEETKQNEEQGKKSRKKLFIFIGIGIIVVIISLALFFFLFFGKGKPKQEVKKQKAAKTEKQTGPPLKPSAEVFYPALVKIPEMIISLMPEFPDFPQKKLRLEIYLKFVSDEARYPAIENLDKIQKGIKKIIIKMRPSELDDVSDKILLKQKFYKLVTEYVKTDSLSSIYFTEFLILDW